MIRTRFSGRSVDGDHDVGRFDDGVGLLALLQLQFVDRLVGDGCGDDRSAADVDADMRRRLPLLNLTIVPLSELRALSFIDCSICWSGRNALKPPCSQLCRPPPYHLELLVRHSACHLAPSSS